MPGDKKVVEKINESSAPLVLPETRSYIFVRQDNRLIKVEFDALIYIRAERDFCSLYLDGGNRLTVSMHLKLLEDALPAGKFMRVHRSFVINLDKVKAIKGNTIETSDAEIPISANYREKLFNILNLN